MMNEECGRNPPFDLRQRTKLFALAVIRLCGSIPSSPEASVIRRQLGRCGTSVGAQYRETCRARSRLEFISKMESALQELDETDYWLELLNESGLSSGAALAGVAAETQELISIFVASVKQSKKV